MQYSIKLFLVTLILSFPISMLAAFDGDYTFTLESADKQTILNIAHPQKGMIVFSTTDSTIYYYNGSKWEFLDKVNIYNGDGILSGNRKIDMNNSTLSFTDGNMTIESNATLHVKHAIQMDGVFYDKDGDVGSIGQVLSSTSTGTDWVTPSANVPYISNTLIGVPVSSTVMITLTGMNFIPDSTVTIPGFDGTINSTQVISPSQIDLNITTGAINTFDLIVSNHDVNNTQWSNNGLGVLRVTNNNGQTQATAGLSCKKILDDGYSTGDGTYWIDPDGDGDTSDAFEVYCDMSGGGWTRIEYANDLPHQAQFSGGDSWKWLPNNFNMTLTDQQINDIRAISTEGKQHYHGTCEGVIHYEYQNGNFSYAFGFRFHNGDETAHGQQNYPNTNITVSNDECISNDNTLRSTDFDIIDIRVPVINVYSRDNSSSEEFGSPLKQYPAWLR